MSDKKKGKPTTIYITKDESGKNYSVDNIKIGCPCMSSCIWQNKLGATLKHNLLIIKREDKEIHTNTCIECGAAIKFVVNQGNNK